MSSATRRLFEIVRTGEAGQRGLALVPVPCDDPDVEERWASTDEDVPRQVVTAFRPRVGRPTAYPAVLPFVPAVRVFVTEMSDRAPEGGEVGPSRWGARWLVEDDSDVLADVLSTLLAEGWAVEPGRELGFPFPGRRTVVRRGERVRLLLEVRVDETRRVVQLLPLV